MPRIGPTELVIILFIILIIFGAGRLPEIGSALGRGIREFRRGQSGEEEPEESDTGKTRKKAKEKV
jgi:sec-independent protein translocase protein TatA